MTDRSRPWTLSDAELDKWFAEILADHGATACSGCGRILDRGDCAWNNGSTEAGTDYAVLEIICQQCGTETIHLNSWYPGIDGFAEFVDVLESEWSR